MKHMKTASYGAIGLLALVGGTIAATPTWAATGVIANHTDYPLAVSITMRNDANVTLRSTGGGITSFKPTKTWMSDNGWAEVGNGDATIGVSMWADAAVGNGSGSAVPCSFLGGCSRASSGGVVYFGGGKATAKVYFDWNLYDAGEPYQGQISNCGAFGSDVLDTHRPAVNTQGVLNNSGGVVYCTVQPVPNTKSTASQSSTRGDRRAASVYHTLDSTKALVKGKRAKIKVYGVSTGRNTNTQQTVVLRNRKTGKVLAETSHRIRTGTTQTASVKLPQHLVKTINKRGFKKVSVTVKSTNHNTRETRHTYKHLYLVKG